MAPLCQVSGHHDLLFRAAGAMILLGRLANEIHLAQGARATAWGPAAMLCGAAMWFWSCGRAPSTTHTMSESSSTRKKWTCLTCSQVSKLHPVVYHGCQCACEPTTALCAGHVCTLDSLKRNFFEPFVLTAEQKEEMCQVEFGHDEPGGKGGDSVQGL